MDHQKIGCFIAALRREKGWTQRELATRLGVTDKAVSRWETGKGLPDIALLRPLSEALGVSINELLSGEAIKPGQELAKSDALVLHTLEAAEKRIRRIWRNLLYALGAVLLAGSLLFLGFDTSFVAFYGAIVGILLLAAAVFFTFQARPKRALFAALGVMLLAFCLLLMQLMHKCLVITMASASTLRYLSNFPRRNQSFNSTSCTTSSASSESSR